jgi:hypothetical protein
MMKAENAAQRVYLLFYTIIILYTSFDPHKKKLENSTATIELTGLKLFKITPQKWNGLKTFQLPTIRKW